MVLEACKLEQKPDKEPLGLCSEEGRLALSQAARNIWGGNDSRLWRLVKGEPWGKCDDLYPFFSR